METESSGLTKQSIVKYLEESVKVAHEAKLNGKHPFGCVLIGPNDEILLRQGNIDTFNHAESTLCREAAAKFSSDFLWGCTLVTNFEPCCMCAGSVYWANIGRILYGASEEVLLGLTGSAEENMTMSLDCRTVVGSGQKAIEVIGPVPEMEQAILSDHRGFWD
ncbi:hypothetical protein OGAPHI_005943 [Ogataea philodendri]|uniref:CMP/dCMP-type deaminase domain-containing protein n=1 Tax=Ogataea philodendri TaxID=1378263 RepID=A0A9P8NYC6_9ASCO|nr:uncharacterized protein OGAPHI_005943 [Ogataea philodendri]KAH3661765.1 hypothetical protein OGAPHI_005943 [Ogataea philodendri]